MGRVARHSCVSVKIKVTMNKIAKQFFAEMIGTFIYVTIGLVGVAQFLKFDEPFLSVAFSFALAGMIAIHTIGHISGGHINPAVSFSFAISGRMSWVAFPVYVAGQMIGGFLGAAIVYVVYLGGINVADPDRTLATAGIFATYPNGALGDVNNGIMFFDQVIGTLPLILMVLSLTDPRNEISAGLTPLLVGLSIGACHMAFGINSFCAMNPARDFGPRIFTAMVYGKQVFTGGNYFFWVP